MKSLAILVGAGLAFPGAMAQSGPGGSGAPTASGRLEPVAAVAYSPLQAGGGLRTAWQDSVVATPRDRQIFRQTMERARRERLDTLSIGEIIVRLGRSFVGAPYAAHTLEQPGPERVVVNLRAFDCVTFVENMLAMARVVRSGDTSFDAYVGELRRIRYRGGQIDGYASRLNYFSEWISDNAAKGVVRPMTKALGGVPDARPIDFMSAHADAYRQLAQPEVLAQIRAIEKRLSATPRDYIPQDRIADVADRIQDGDIIAMTSSLPGLDVAHTGIAIRVNGELHLLNAPLVGKAVQISALPLADRIRGIRTQTGIMVARPL